MVYILELKINETKQNKQMSRYISQFVPFVWTHNFSGKRHWLPIYR